jgi:hypothetical protein
LKYVTSSAKESTTKNEVDTNNSSSEIDIDIYALEVVPKAQEEVSSPDVIMKDERKIEKAISPISLGNDLMTLQGILSIPTNVFTTSIQINHFCDFRYDCPSQHLIKLTNSHI